MYNIGARYMIIGRVTNGTSVLAYMVKDSKLNGKVYAIEKSVIEELALRKQIYNCTAQVYGNIVNLKGIDCKLSQMPRYDKNGQRIVEKVEESVKVKNTADLKIIGKVQSGRVISAYIIQAINADNAVTKVVSRENTIKLARSGRLINAKCQRSEDTYMLRAAPGYNLSTLPVYNSSGVKI